MGRWVHGGPGESCVGLSSHSHVHVQDPSDLPAPVQLLSTPHAIAWGCRVLPPASSFPLRFRPRETDSSHSAR